MSDMSGGVLGLGIIVSLHDAFTATAKRLEKQMKNLTGASASFVTGWNRSMSQFKWGVGIMAAGIAGLAAISFPVAQAAKFQIEMARVNTIIDKNIKSTKEWKAHWKQMQSDTLDMGAMFGESPEAHAKALYSVIAKGYDDKPEKAKELLKVANMMSIATDTPVTTAVEGFLSVMNSFGIGNAKSVTPEQAGKQYMKASDQMFKAMAIGGFSSNPSETDFEAISRSIGKIAPMASTIGLDFGSLMSTWAVSTQGGQNAALSATGLRQLFKDLITPTKKLENFTDATGWTQEKMISSIRESGSLIPLLTKVREYAGFTNKDMQGLSSAMNNPEISRRFKELAASSDGAKGLMDSSKGREFVKLLSDAGGIDILKVNHVFKSIWGMTAVLPLLTTQFRNLKAREDEVRNASGLTEQAFKEMSATVTQRARIVKSSWQALMTVIGTPLLAPVAGALKLVADGLNGIRRMAERFPTVTSMILKTISATALLLTTMGGILAVVGLWGMASRLYIFHASKMIWFTRIFGSTLNMAFLRVFAVVGLVILSASLLRRAWDRNFLGMRTTTLGWYNTIRTTIGAVVEAWNSFRKTGSFSISEETYKSLKDSGLLGLVGNIIAITYRLYVFGQGFIKGWKEGWKAIADGAKAAFTAIKPTLDQLSQRSPVIKRLTELLGQLFTPTKDGVEGWRKVGETVGRFAVALAVIIPVGLAVGRVITTVFGVIGWVGRAFMTLIRILTPIGRIIFTVGRFFIGLIAAANPLTLLIGALVAVVGTLYLGWKYNFLGLREIVQTAVDFWKEAFRIAVEFIGGAGGRAIRFFKEGFSTVWTKVKPFLTNVAMAIFLVFYALPKKMWEVGGNIISSLKRGAADKWQGVKDWFSSTSNWVVQKFKDTFGIKSPSTVFKGIGQFIMDGLSLGLDKGWVGVKEKLGGFWESIKTGARNAWEGISGGGSSGSSGSSYSGPYSPGRSGKKLGLDGVNTNANSVVRSAVGGLTGGWTEAIAGFCSRWVRQVMSQATGGKSNKLFGSTAAISEKIWKSAGLTKTLAELGGTGGLKAGDVLFQGFGSGGAGHVGIYLGNGKVAENSTRYGSGDARGVTDLAHFGTITSVGRYPGMGNTSDPSRLGVPANIRAAKEQMLAIAKGKDSEGGSSVTSAEMARIETYLKSLAERPASTVLKVDSKTLAKVVHGQQQQQARTGGARPAPTSLAGGKR